MSSIWKHHSQWSNGALREIFRPAAAHFLVAAHKGSYVSEIAADIAALHAAGLAGCGLSKAGPLGARKALGAWFFVGFGLGEAVERFEVVASAVGGARRDAEAAAADIVEKEFVRFLKLLAVGQASALGVCRDFLDELVEGEHGRPAFRDLRACRAHERGDIMFVAADRRLRPTTGRIPGRAAVAAYVDARSRRRGRRRVSLPLSGPAIFSGILRR